MARVNVMQLRLCRHLTFNINSGNPMHNLHKAVSAIATSIACSAFAATPAPIFQSQALGISYLPLSLFDDGQVLTYGPSEYGPDTCPIVTRPDQTGCVPPLVRQTLALATAGGGWTVLPFNVLNVAYRFNHTGKGVIWHSEDTPNALLVDAYTGSSTPFAPGIASPFASCTGDTNYQSQFTWLTLTETNKLLGQKIGCAPSYAIDFWSSTGTQEMPMPAGYASMQLIDVNKSEQLAITARQNSSTAASRALSWSQKAGFKTLPLPLLSILTGYTQSEALAIDDAGNILGNLLKRDGSSHAAIWRAGKATDIGTLSGYKYSTALGMSSAGVALLCAYDTVDGYGAPAGQTQLFLWANGAKASWSTSVTAKDGNTPPTGCVGSFRSYSKSPLFWPNGKGQWLMYGNTRTYLLTPGS